MYHGTIELFEIISRISFPFLFQDFSTGPSVNIITTNDMRFMNAIGQRSEISFNDLFAINTIYCAGKITFLERFSLPQLRD